ncbi:unnamed protein product [Ilex paraguariensis]|uniref:RING-type domain-containing protein n=1 Tax=Ilex paraguariensis TaxID=185542 RepID=A0ABC8QPB8_9AQUA
MSTTIPSSATFSAAYGGSPPPPPVTTSHNLTNLGLGYAIAIALGFLVLLSAILLTSYICCRSRRSQNPNQNPSTNNSSSDNGIYLPRIIFVAEDDDDESNNEIAGVGLDQAVINSYPRFAFSKDRGSSGGNSDSMCSICLCEYREAEMLRMLPDCKHYFHLMCIDAWLKLNASCPVCRNSPLPTPLSTPLQEVVPLSQYSDGRRSTNNSSSDNGIYLPRIIFVAEDDDDESNNEIAGVGLDQAVINSYPRFAFSKDRGSSGGNSDSMCSICLCEYREAEMLRMLPDCKHYFHLMCIDAWLKLNASCPVCRNSPLPTPLSTPLQEVVPLSQYSDGRRSLRAKFWGVIRGKAFSPPPAEDFGFKSQKIQQEINYTRDSLKESSSRLRHKAFLAEILGLVESVQAYLPLNEGTHEHKNELGTLHPLSRPKQKPDDPAEYFLIEEIRKYVRVKPNRLGKQNFMGANGTFTSIGHACFAMKKDLEEYMDYDIGEICNDDWKLAQKLMVHGCDPLPRRRCFSRAPKLYDKPFPINESLWMLPDDRNVQWSQYRCKNFVCLGSNSTRKGFFKCADCFNLTHHEMPRWVKLTYQDPNSKLTADFLITEVLNLKSGEIRIGLDFSVGTGTFAARMREFNVTIVSATINLGAPFNEMIALRGLIPLYLSINQRLPFFENTLDLIHTTKFLDGWIDYVLLDFVLYDWDRVLRPGGLLWIDSFFCLKQDLDDYLEAFKMLRYKKHKWVILPKLDKNDHREVFFSAILEKPPRPFR